MRIRRIDENQPQIVKALRAAGAFVLPIHTLGHGAPDIFVWHRSKWTCLEIKNPAKQPNQRKLTPQEQEWHDCAGAGAVAIVETIEDALKAIR